MYYKASTYQNRSKNNFTADLFLFLFKSRGFLKRETRKPPPCLKRFEKYRIFQRHAKIKLIHSITSIDKHIIWKMLVGIQETIIYLK